MAVDVSDFQPIDVRIRLYRNEGDKQLVLEFNDRDFEVSEDNEEFLADMLKRFPQRDAVVAFMHYVIMQGI